MIAVVTNGLNKAYFSAREHDPVFNGYVVKITRRSDRVQTRHFQDRLETVHERRCETDHDAGCIDWRVQIWKRA